MYNNYAYYMSVLCCSFTTKVSKLISCSTNIKAFIHCMVCFASTLQYSNVCKSMYMISKCLCYCAFEINHCTMTSNTSNLHRFVYKAVNYHLVKLPLFVLSFVKNIFQQLTLLHFPNLKKEKLLYAIKMV